MLLGGVAHGARIIRGSSALPLWCGLAEARKPRIFSRMGSKAVHILRPQRHSREEPGESGEVSLSSWAIYMYSPA